ncbi:UdgX family uracil-DNA binding protein [Paraburkholderia jirisanensis]
MSIFVIEDSYQAWRAAALQALADNLAPETIEWRIEAPASASYEQAVLDYGEGALTVRDPQQAAPVGINVRISRDLAEQLKDAALFRDPQRWAFLYKVLWRWQHGDRAVTSAADGDGMRLYRMAKTVRRDKHDMIAYVRFSPYQAKAGESSADAPEFVSWYEPEHDVLAWSVQHFARRMGRLTWLITTPRGAAFWNGRAVHLTQRRAWSVDHRPDTADEAESLWLAYYRSTFNPARLNETALEQHMPVRFWKGLPEGQLIPAMISEAKSGAQRIAQASGVGALGGKVVSVEAGDAQPQRDEPTSLDACRRCELWQHATQAVAGRGPADARIMLIGEQPGDQEDLAGKPFVGPAGQLLEVALTRAALPRAEVYLTNAVKHFKWTLRGKRRMHKTPNQREVDACGYWLEHELQRVRPRVVVVLGATALGALLHQTVSLRDYVDAPFEVDGMWVIATYHPSFALRQTDEDSRARVLDAISDALARARELSEKLKP